MKALLALAFMASTAIAAPSPNIVRYFDELEECHYVHYDASNPHCKAMKAAEKKAIAEGCYPTDGGVNFHFQRKDGTRCEYSQ